MKRRNKITRILTTIALSMAMLATALPAHAASDYTTFSATIPGYGISGTTYSQKYPMLEKDADIIQVDMTDINGKVYDIQTLNGLFNWGNRVDDDSWMDRELGDYEILDPSSSTGTLSTINYGSKTTIYWKVGYYNTAHTNPVFQVKKGKRIYCAFTYSGANASVMFGICDPNDHLSMVTCGSGTFSYTFTAKSTGGYHFVVANRGSRRITVNGYFRVEK